MEPFVTPYFFAYAPYYFVLANFNLFINKVIKQNYKVKKQINHCQFTLFTYIEFFFIFDIIYILQHIKCDYPFFYQ